MAGVNEAVLRSAILVQLLEHQGEEILVKELVKDLLDAGFLEAFVNYLLTELFFEQEGVLLCGEPLSLSVLMPGEFQPPEELVAAHQRAAEEATRRLAKVLPTFFELATASG